MVKYSYCTGILLNADYMEEACPKKENCIFYDEFFFLRHSHHLNEFEQLHNEVGKACKYYNPMEKEKERKETINPFET